MGHPSRVSLLGNAALFDYTNVLSVCDVISLFQQKARRVYMGFKNADLHVGVVSCPGLVVGVETVWNTFTWNNTLKHLIDYFYRYQY
jgi:hypothetical protein